MDGLYDNINAGAYNVDVKYPSKPAEPAVLRKSFKQMTPEEKKLDLNQIQADYEAAVAQYRADQKAYYARQNELEELFRKDLEEHHGMTGHPKANKLFSMAWERGHSSGYSEVASVYDDLVELVK